MEFCSYSAHPMQLSARYFPIYSLKPWTKENTIEHTLQPPSHITQPLSLSLSLTNLPSMNSQCSTFTLLHSCVLIASVNVANNETQKCIYGKVIQNIQCHGTIIFSFEHIPCFIFGIYFTAFLMCGSFRLKLKPI